MITNAIHPASDQAAAAKGLAHEVARRRTFAIISHPDAGKTTLTEKLLLYAGAIELAGAVRTGKHGRHATADWMAIEQERGITVTSTSLQFDAHGYRFNLLDTPGHQDFSEDTYRTLMAADGTVMVLDAARGIERQTRKLFEVCRLRRLPIVTFINKMDLPSREPLALLDEIEQVLDLSTVPFNWPIGDGVAFQGVYDLRRREVLRYQRTDGGQRRVRDIGGDLSGPEVMRVLGDAAGERLREEVDLLTGAGSAFDRRAFQTGEQTPVFFGSALTNFGVEPFFAALTDLLPPPGSRPSDHGLVPPTEETFSGFIFKIQANMDPRHRDRMAFLRVCSGRFRKDMEVTHPRPGRSVRLTRPHRLFARERETVEEAYPGDVVGLVNPGLFAIGDTLVDGLPRQFEPIPRFPPECFGRLQSRDTARYKQFHKGLAQLEEEGAIQVLFPSDQASREPILAAVGELQLDVVIARLRGEYGVASSVERLPYIGARWIEGDPQHVARMVWSPRGSLRAEDRAGRPVALFASAWALDYCQTENPTLTFHALG